MGLDFLLTALIVVIVPGTGVVFTVASGLALGRRLSVAAALGCTFGIVPAMLASTLGLAALLHASALMFQVVKICGVVYLLYLAWMTLQEEGPLSLKGDETPGSRHFWAVARTGFLINVLNPKLTVFFMAFLPQFIEPASGNVTGQMLLLGGVFMAMTFAVFLLYGHFAALIGTRVLRRPSVMAWLRRGLAAAFAGFGLRLALAER
ncbi:MAG: LysE family translocator [Pseudomonadota bacterium]